MHNPDDALDVTQESFLRAFRAIRSVDADRPFYPWLHTIARNAALSFVKRRRPAKAADEQQLPPWTITPEQLVETDEQVEQLRRAINSLGEDDRRLLHMRHFEQMDYAQIAEALGVPRGTVASRLYAARDRLRRRFEEQTP